MPRGKVTDVNLQSGVVGEGWEFGFEEPHPMAVTPTAVGGEIERGGLGILLVAHQVPPSPNAHQGKFRRVVTRPHVDESLMGRHIIHAIGTRLALRPVRKIIDIDFGRGLLRVPFTTGVPKVAHDREWYALNIPLRYS